MAEDSTEKTQRFPMLFQPLRIGRIELPNRIVMLPMTTGYCRSDHTIGERLIRYYKEVAQGNFWPSVVEDSSLKPANKDYGTCFCRNQIQ